MRDKPILWALIILLVQALLICILVPSSLLKKVNDIEEGWMESTYSEASVIRLRETADSWHYTLTRETGLADWMKWMFLPERDPNAKNGGMARLGEKVWFPYIESRGEALDDMVKTFFMRLSSLFIWTPLLVVIAIPSFFDGFMERGIKQHTFKFPSPLKYRWGIRCSAVILFLLNICLLSPLPTHPLILPGGIILSVIVIGQVVIGNLPKRI